MWRSRLLPPFVALALLLTPGVALADDPDVDAEKTRMELERKQLEHDQKMQKETLQAEQELRKKQLEDKDDDDTRVLERTEHSETIVVPAAP